MNPDERLPVWYDSFVELLRGILEAEDNRAIAEE